MVWADRTAPASAIQPGRRRDVPQVRRLHDRAPARSWGPFSSRGGRVAADAEGLGELSLPQPPQHRPQHRHQHGAHAIQPGQEPSAIAGIAGWIIRKTRQMWAHFGPTVPGRVRDRAACGYARPRPCPRHHRQDRCGCGRGTGAALAGQARRSPRRRRDRVEGDGIATA